MFGTYFYNKNIRNIVILFGTIFNNIEIRRTLKDGTVQSRMRVPIAYGPAQKYLTRLKQGPIEIQGTGQDAVETKDKLGMTLPRMSFEITTMTYDAARKLQSSRKIKEVKLLGPIDSIDIVDGGSGYTVAPTIAIESPTAGNTATATATVSGGKITAVTMVSNGTGYTSVPNVTVTPGGTDNPSKATLKANVDSNTTTLNTVYTPVPYNFEIDLSIMVLASDDGTQILEQILPYFTPEFHVTLNEMKTMGIKRDIPVILNSMTTEDEYENDFMTRRSLTHTLSFTVQGYIYGPLKDQGIIREVDVNAGTNFTDFDEKLVNIDVKPNPLTAEPDDAPTNTTTTITDL